MAILTRGKRINFLFIALDKGRHTTGGGHFFIELGKQLLKRGHNLVILTSETGKTSFEREGISAEFWIVDKGKGIENQNLVISAFTLTKIMLKACFTLRRKKLEEKTVILPISDMLNDVLPALFAKGRDVKRVLLTCLIVPSPFKGYKGVFTRGWHLPEPRNTLNYLQGRLSILCFRRGYDLVIPQSDYIRSFLGKHLPQKKIAGLDLRPGLEWDVINQATGKDKKYDACWMGRFHPYKGCDDLIEIWHMVRKKKEKARLLIIGNVAGAFEPLIKRYGLEQGVVFPGFLTGEQKFQFLKEGTVFLFPGYYDMGAQVIAEAMACGLPVVSYDLPTFQGLYSKGMVKVPIGNKEAFAAEVIRLLDDDEERARLSQEALEYASERSWEDTAEKFLGLVSTMLGDSPGD